MLGCQGSLTIYNGGLLGCQGSLTIVDLLGCQGDLLGCQGSLTIYNGGRLGCQGSLTIYNGGMLGCQGSLIIYNVGLLECQGSPTIGDLLGCQGSLTIYNGDLLGDDIYRGSVGMSSFTDYSGSVGMSRIPDYRGSVRMFSIHILCRILFWQNKNLLVRIFYSKGIFNRKFQRFSNSTKGKPSLIRECITLVNQSWIFHLFYVYWIWRISIVNNQRAACSH